MDNIISKYKVTELNIVNTKTPKFINRTLDKIFVINLKKDVMRRNYIVVLMQKYKINYTLISVDKINAEDYHKINTNNDITVEEAGCLLSHLWCLNSITKNEYKNAIIFEDDIIFHKRFHHLFKQIYRPTYDFLLLGLCDFSFSKINKDHVHNNLYVPHPSSINVYGAHANYYSLAGATKMLELKTRNPSFFDSDYHGMFQYFKNSAYVCYPNLVASDISTTNLSHTYPFFSVYEKHYYDKCFINFKFNDYHFLYLDILHKNKDIQILENDTFETYMKKLIYYTFYDKDKEQHIKDRISCDFFTIDDIKYMIHNKVNI